MTDFSAAAVFRRFWPCLLLLLAAAVLPYLNTFSVPFYFDDTNNILDNPLIRDLPEALRKASGSRGLARLTFALNYQWGRFEPFSYHLVNLVIHTGTVLTVWAVLRRLLDRDSPWPLVGALLFAVHPLQTQAVTYVVQRMTSLSALFFLLGILGYLAFLDGSGRQRRFAYGAALLCGALAVLTKENTAVLPVALLLVERFFRPGRPWLEQLRTLLPFCLAPVLMAVVMLTGAGGTTEAEGLESVARYSEQLLNLQNNTPLNYLVTQFSVLWHYLRLLILPYGQMLDYGWPVATGITLTSAVALAGLLGLGAAAWILRNRRPLIAFGIAWFFVTLSVESSIIPLDPAFEHRLYLPMFGFVLVAIDLLRGIPSSRVAFGVVAGLVLVLAVLTWQRNALWNDRVAFVEDNLRLSPRNERVMVVLANAYVEQGRVEEGLRMIERARAVNPAYPPVYTAGGKILIDRGEGEKAIPLLEQGLKYNPNSPYLFEYLGICYGQMGNFEKSLMMLHDALYLAPEDASVLTNIGAVYSWLGEDEKAIEYFEKSLKLVPDSEKTLFNYAMALYKLGRKPETLARLAATVAVNPANLDAQFGLASVALELGRREETVRIMNLLRSRGDERALELEAMLNR